MSTVILSSSVHILIWVSGTLLLFGRGTSSLTIALSAEITSWTSVSGLYKSRYSSSNPA
jgi:hypothetical protein